MTRAIGSPLTAEESTALVAVCRSLIGVPFRHRGLNPKIGLDCRGLIGVGLLRIGRTFKDIQAYGRYPHKDGLRIALIENFGEPLPVSQRKPGDVVLMRLRGSEPRHVGLFTRLPDGRFGLLHTHSEMKYVAEHGADSYHADYVEVFRP